LAHDALTILFDDNWRRAVRIDVQGFVAAAHHLFEVPADQSVVLDEVADFPGREGIEIAHGAFSLRLVGLARIDGSREAASDLGIERGPQRLRRRPETEAHGRDGGQEGEPACRSMGCRRRSADRFLNVMLRRGAIQLVARHRGFDELSQSRIGRS
jgi:hypothetical protein